MAAYGRNLPTARFLVMVHGNQAIMEQLRSGDFQSVDTFPGLEEGDRALLKSINWNKMKIDIKDANFLNDPSIDTKVAALFCEKGIGPGQISQRCVV